MHRHVRLLIVLTILVRGGMYLGYPLQSGLDDNQAAQLYLPGRLLEGDLLIGNLRYNTGYPLFIAPFAAVGQLFGRFDERFLLLVQVALSALVPFLLYDLVRRHHSRRAALLVALLALLDPLGLQWAHQFLPVSLVAFCFTLSVWILDRALRHGPGVKGFVLAGLLLGLATLARVNFAPVAALAGMLLLCAPVATFRRRLPGFAITGLSSVALVALHLYLVHLPSTGTFRLSCVAGTNMIESLRESGVPIRGENGAATRRLLQLLALPPLATFDWTTRSYPNWQQPGPWAPAEARDAFLSQKEVAAVPEQLDISFPGALVHYLGPCETDSLLTRVALEALLSRPLEYARSLPGEVADLLAQRFDPYLWHLPHSNTLEFREDDSLPAFFRRAWSVQGDEYRGAVVWPLPMIVYSHVRDSLNLIKLLVLPALLWALVGRRRFYAGAAALLLAWLTGIALVDLSDVRIVAPLWPLWPLLIGGLLADLWQRLTDAWSGGRNLRARRAKVQE